MPASRNPAVRSGDGTVGVAKGATELRSERARDEGFGRSAIPMALSNGARVI